MWFCPDSSTNKTDHHNITEILLKVALNTITLTYLYKILKNEGTENEERESIYNNRIMEVS
jgi:hypothetical protein